MKKIKITHFNKEMKKPTKIDFQKLLDRFSTHVQIFDGVTPLYEGDKPEKQPLYFGCNYQDIPTVCIQWSEKGRGFGEYTFQLKDGKMYCDNECDSRETVKRILCLMVDQCIFLDEKEEK